MRDVTQKFSSLRYARAQGEICCSEETIALVQQNAVSKGNVSETARIAGIAAAKRTSELLVFCHPIPLDWIEVSTEIDAEQKVIRVSAEVKSVWKTGVEMEALTAVSVALLNIYDMLKPHDSSLKIQNIAVTRKTGGEKQFLDRFSQPISTGILIISTSAAKGQRKDKVGPIIREFLVDYPIEICAFQILPDDPEAIATTIEEWIDQRGIQLLLTAGGTGLGPYDQTPESTRKVADREIPGIAETIRSFGQQRTQFAMLSRGIVAQRKNSIIVNLPGSSRGAAESLHAIFPGILHAFVMMEARKHDEQSPVHQIDPGKQ